MIAWLAALACAPAENVDESCTLAFVPSPGPLSEQTAAATDPVALAELRIREARLASDPGFLTLAELAVDCALSREPRDVAARRWKGHIDLQFHRFAQAEQRLTELVAETDHWRDHLLLGDAKMEQGDLDGAERSYERALDERPTIESYDRTAQLAWLRGDLQGAIAQETLAFGAAHEDDPEVAAWVATALGTWKMYAGETPNELGLALKLLPDYPHAHLALGRYWLSLGEEQRARHHLQEAGPTVAATRALSELDRSADVSAVRLQDPRGYGLWLALTDPAAALPLLEAELSSRRDATTVIGREWVAWRAGAPFSTEAVREALATGIAEPQVLLMAGELLGDGALKARAAAVPAGLLPSERVRAAVQDR
jgi:tetratricopeptide (TPR) repeat protein